MTAAAARLTCPACGTEWEVAARPDGAMPAAARCPKSRGGCGKVRKVPAAARPAPPAGDWDPPSDPRTGYWLDTGRCGDCGGRVRVSPRGTAMWCSGCEDHITPPAVQAPYQRSGGNVRVVRSQAERDREAIELARNKGLMLDQLAALAADDRVAPESGPVIDWFVTEVKNAASQARLGELVDALKTAGIKRRHWWQGRPAALDPPAYDNDQDDDEDYEDDEDDEPGPGGAGPMTWAGAVAACGWSLSPAAGGCQIIDHGQVCGAGTAQYIATVAGPGGWVCTRHYAALSEAITEQNYRAGLPAAPRPLLPDYGAELAIREWRWNPHGVQLCGLEHMKPHGWDYVPPQLCQNRAEHLIKGGAVCGSCFYALNQPIGGH